ncbi:MAG: acyltransferase family protein [Bacteroidia bacterium]
MSNRKIEIDVLRGVAVLMVVVFHFNTIFYFGWMGVDIFFVLSGYLVSSLIFGEYVKYNHVNIIRFFIRRGFKIYPVFFLFLGITILAKLINSEDISLKILIYESTFVRNYLGGFWAHTWSLDVEEHFYILLAFCSYIVCNKTKLILNVKLVNISFSFVFFGCLFFRLFSLYIENRFGTSSFFNAWARGVQTHCRIDSLLFGVLISYNLFFNKKQFIQWYLKNKTTLRVISFSLLIFVLILSKNDGFKTTISYTLLYLSFGILLLDILVTETIKSIVKTIYFKHFFEIIAFVGINSYAIYLFHPFVKDYVLNNKLISLNQSSLYSFIIYLFVSILIGYFTTKIVEANFLKLRAKYFPSK